MVVICELFDKKLHIDDPAGAVGVHFANGILDIVVVGLFATYNFQDCSKIIVPAKFGIFYGENIYLLGVRLRVY